MKIQTKRLAIEASQLEIKAAKAGENPAFSGYASVFGGNDSYNDTIAPGAFAQVIASGVMPRMFFNHEHGSVPIGKWTEIKEDDRGLYVKGELFAGVPQADAVAVAMKNGGLDGLSIGYTLDPDGYARKENGGRFIKSIAALQEISVVSFPADGAARIDIKSALEGVQTVRDFEHALRDAGFSKSEALAFTATARRVFLSESEGAHQKAAALAAIQTFKL